TRDGANRWRRFRSLVAPPAAPPGDGDELSGGAWRARFWPERAHWPASWTALERVKRLSRDGRRLWKFEGLGRLGAAVHARAQALAAEGWTPAPIAGPDPRGFVSYPFVEGRPLAAAAIDGALLATMGRYCAARTALFPAAAEGEAASEAARTNVALL